jgi:hypothetical protein
MQHVTAAAINATDKIFSTAYGSRLMPAKSSGPFKYIQTLRRRDDDSVKMNHGNATTPAIQPSA